MTESEYIQLSSIARSRSMAAALTLRARIVLAAAMGQSSSAIAQRFELTQATVGKWRQRFLKHRIAGLHHSRSHLLNRGQTQFLSTQSACSDTRLILTEPNPTLPGPCLFATESQNAKGKNKNITGNRHHDGLRQIHRHAPPRTRSQHLAQARHHLRPLYAIAQAVTDNQAAERVKHAKERLF